MKKIISVLLVLVSLVCIGSVAAVPSSAANTVATATVQKNINDFITFLKKKNYNATEKCYYFNEAQDKDGDETYQSVYKYYPEGEFFQFKVKYAYFQTRADIIFFIPQQYNGKMSVEFDYTGADGETLLASANNVSIPDYSGYNITFTKVGGNSTDPLWNASCNSFVRNAFISLDYMIYKNERNEIGFTAFGFTMMCRKHLYHQSVAPATMIANGTLKATCHWCAKYGVATIPKIQTLKLSSTAFYYTGKVITPGVTVKDAKGKVLKKGTDYTLVYGTGRKAVGQYAVKVKFKGSYGGSALLYFTINPLKPTITSIAAASKGFTLKWKKVSGVSGYQIQYSTASNFSGAKTITARGAATLAAAVGTLKSGTAYYVRIRSYKATTFAGKSVYVYSGWNAAKPVKAK